MSDRDLIERLKQAKLDRFPHGGARLAVINGNDRELIADFYGDGEWTEFFDMLIRHAIADHSPDKETFAGTPGFPPETREQERSMRRDRYPPRFEPEKKAATDYCDECGAEMEHKPTCSHGP